MKSPSTTPEGEGLVERAGLIERLRIAERRWVITGHQQQLLTEAADALQALIAEGEEMKAARSLPGYDDSASRDASATLSLLDRSVAELTASGLWAERQEDCAKYGADISMPTVEVRVDELTDLLRGAAEAEKTIEGLGRLGELVTAFVDPSGVLDVTGLRNRIVSLETELASLRGETR